VKRRDSNETVGESQNVGDRFPSAAKARAAEISDFSFEVALLTSCAFTSPIEPGRGRIALRRDNSPHSRGRYRGGRSKPSPLRREIQMPQRETANANSRGRANASLTANAEADADPSPLKRVRDDSLRAGRAFFRYAFSGLWRLLGPSLGIASCGDRSFCRWLGRRILLAGDALSGRGCRCRF
jgi:hypothetical protein